MCLNENHEICLAEGLGIIVFCITEDMALCQWDSERNLWIDSDHEPMYDPERTKCDCGNVITLPTKEEVEQWESQNL